MKKLIIIFLTLFFFPVSLYAVEQVNPGKKIGVDKNESVVQQGKNLKLDQVEVVGDSSPAAENTTSGTTGSQNKLKIKIENKDEDQQLQTETQEQQSKSKGIGQQVRILAIQQAGKAAQNAFQQMSQEEGDQETSEKPGLGEQVRELARQHGQIQEEIDVGLEKIQKRNQFLKLLLGPNKKAISNLENQLTSNQQLINKLNQMAEDADEATQDQIQTAQQLIEQQNQYLQQTIQAEEDNPGILSFIVNLFR
jgi:hypothetical protein